MRMSCVILQRRLARRSAIFGAADADVPVLGVFPIMLGWISMGAFASYLTSAGKESVGHGEY